MDQAEQRRRLRKVAKMVEKYEDRFEMSEWMAVPDVGWLAPGKIAKYVGSPDEPIRCGTTACVAGWACAIYKKEVDPDESWHENGARILGIDDETADFLFNGSADHQTAAEAAAVLRNLARGLHYEDA